MIIREQRMIFSSLIIGEFQMQCVTYKCQAGSSFLYRNSVRRLKLTCEMPVATQERCVVKSLANSGLSRLIDIHVAFHGKCRRV